MRLGMPKVNGVEVLHVLSNHTVQVNGKSVSRTDYVASLGKLSQYDDGEPNFKERLRRSFKEGSPIIKELEQYAPKKKPTRAVLKNIGSIIPNSIFDLMGINEILSEAKSRMKLDYDLLGLTRLLTLGRLFDPASKLHTFDNQRDNYLIDVTSSSDVNEVYKCLDILDKKSVAIQQRMNLRLKKLTNRKNEVVFYDVTNYDFETDFQDEKGLRKRGPAKSHKGCPIVQMGLFIDNHGIPISYKVFPGNHVDQTTMRPAMKESIDNFTADKVIVVADGGLNSNMNLAHFSQKGNGYVVSKSVRKTDKDGKRWILDPKGYREMKNSNGDVVWKVKSETYTRTVKDENGKSVDLREKRICFWSKKHYEREMQQNKAFIEYAQSCIEFPDKLKDKPKKVQKFLDEETFDRKSGEVIEKPGKILSINEKKLGEYQDLMGYYTILTSEIDKTDEEIIRIYRGLSKIENSFRIIKSDLEGRPVFVRTPEHINAHFLICFIALTILRVIQYNILIAAGKKTTTILGWTEGLSAARIVDALGNWCAVDDGRGIYKLTKETDDLRTVLNAFGINVDEIGDVTTGDVRSLKRKCVYNYSNH